MYMKEKQKCKILTIV
jgi:large subunit ribosomal protein L11